MKEVMIVVGAGQISMAIARRIGAGKKIILGDKNIENAKNIQKTMVDAGFDVEIMEVDLSSREDILKMIETANEIYNQDNVSQDKVNETVTLLNDRV